MGDIQISHESQNAGRLQSNDRRRDILVLHLFGNEFLFILFQFDWF